VEGVDALARRQGRGTRLVARKANAPDLGRGIVNEKERTRITTRMFSEAEKALKEIEERMKEREEWSDQARRSFQNRRSRSQCCWRVESDSTTRRLDSLPHTPDSTRLDSMRLALNELAFDSTVTTVVGIELGSE
jgi:hypothetical protein